MNRAKLRHVYSSRESSMCFLLYFRESEGNNSFLCRDQIVSRKELRIYSSTQRNGFFLIYSVFYYLTMLYSSPIECLFYTGKLVRIVGL